MLRIERAGVADLPGAYRTCLLTSDAGEDASSQHDDPDLLGHVYVGPYIVHPGGTQYIVVDDHGSAGYLLSTDDTLAFEAWAEDRWWPLLRDRYPEALGTPGDIEMIRYLHEPERTPPDLAGEYPAHFHIDLQRRVRGRGLGRRLIERLLTELRDRGVAGVHLGVDSENTNAVGFYEHLGFRQVGREEGGLLMGMRLEG